MAQRKLMLPSFHGNGLSQAIYLAPNIKAATNVVTVKFDRPAVCVDLRVTEYSGLMRSNAYDAGASATGISASANSGLVTLSATNELLFGAGMTATTFTGAGLGFTQRVITLPDAIFLKTKSQVPWARLAHGEPDLRRVADAIGFLQSSALAAPTLRIFYKASIPQSPWPGRVNGSGCKRT
jgi:hypothetical protein